MALQCGLPSVDHNLWIPRCRFPNEDSNEDSFFQMKTHSHQLLKLSLETNASPDTNTIIDQEILTSDNPVTMTTEQPVTVDQSLMELGPESDSTYLRAACSVCLRVIPVMLDCTCYVRLYHPHLWPSPGSGILPSNLALIQPIASLCVPSTSASSITSTTVTQTSFQAPPRVRVLKKIPRSSCNYAAGKLTAILDGVVAANDATSWTRLLYFASRCLRVPKHGGCRWSLTT